MLRDVRPHVHHRWGIRKTWDRQFLRDVFELSVLEFSDVLFAEQVNQENQPTHSPGKISPIHLRCRKLQFSCRAWDVRSKGPQSLVTAWVGMRRKVPPRGGSRDSIPHSTTTKICQSASESSLRALPRIAPCLSGRGCVHALHVIQSTSTITSHLCSCHFLLVFVLGAGSFFRVSVRSESQSK